MSTQILHGDCSDVLRDLDANSIDACVTDPPYGLTSGKKGGSGVSSIDLESPYGRARISVGNGQGGFMGMKWDSDVPPAALWREVFRVLKPGAHLLAFFGSRTYHRGVVEIEDAGFEIRDQIMWLYGSGFPKSHNLDGAWEGWGTALKPAHEPIVVARKPLIGTVAQNVAAHGTGALNIDASRVHAHDSQGYAYTVQRMMPGAGQNATGKTHQEGVEYSGETKDGRWPANVLHDGSEEVVAAFPSAPGAIAPVTGKEPTGHGFSGNVYGAPGQQGRQPSDRRDGGGSAARFFYCAKASKSDRDEGLTNSPKPFVQFQTGNGTSGKPSSISEGRTTEYRNHHPTVKPTALMRYLCRLVTPPGGTVLDPFMGSGSTGKAAILEGFRFIGIEREPDYIEIARARIGHAQESREGMLL